MENKKSETENGHQWPKFPSFGGVRGGFYERKNSL
jgi:hypothetical protein